MDYNQLDKELLWHPFTHQYNKADNLLITKAEGLYYFDASGNKYMDAVSSWWVNLHGHTHPYITDKVSKQASTLEHVMFSGFTHPPAIELARRLKKHLPASHSKIFYSDNGSTAVEVALKMTLQFWHNQNKPKHIFIALENAYHGDTFGSMSVSARNVFNNAFDNQLFHVAHIPHPTPENVEQIKEVIGEWSKNHSVAGFIFEPLVQGAGGMFMYNAKALDEILRYCKELDIITIADEVMTGFGRTGKFFACDYLSNAPDIMCLSKGLTGGYLPLGVTSCNDKIYEAYLSSDKNKTFFHGHSYTANPLACSAGLASLDLLEEVSTWQSIANIQTQQKQFAEQLKTHKACNNLRTLGTILALNINSTEESNYLNSEAKEAPAYFLTRGVIIRPLGNVIYLIPPYCTKKEELKHMHDVIQSYLDSLVS